MIAVLSGRLAGVVASQACFTLVVAVLFAQLAPPTWRLGPERVLDVLLGALIGLAVGAAVWPAGGHGEVRRAAARCLDAAADLVDGTTDWLAGAAPVPWSRSGWRPCRPGSSATRRRTCSSGPSATSGTSTSSTGSPCSASSTG